MALRKLTFFTINRWYLLTSLLVGLLIPLLKYIEINFYQQEVAEVAPIIYVIQDAPVQIAATVDSMMSQQSIDWQLYFKYSLWIVYGIGAFILLARFIKGLWTIRGLYTKGIKEDKEGYTLITTPKDHLPFSFMKCVFVSDTLELKKEYEQIIRHEITHVEGRHSLDILFLEIINVLFWFNPLIYLFKTALRQTHEYLADAAVVKDTSRRTYGTLLLKQSLSGLQIALTHQFFHSHIKKRITMMYQKKSGRSAWLKYTLTLPVLALLFFIFSGYKSTVYTSSDFSNDIDFHCDGIGAVFPASLFIEDMGPSLHTRSGFNVQFPDGLKEMIQDYHLGRNFLVIIDNKPITENLGDFLNVENDLFAKELIVYHPDQARELFGDNAKNGAIQFRYPDQSGTNKLNVITITSSLGEELLQGFQNAFNANEVESFHGDITALLLEYNARRAEHMNQLEDLQRVFIAFLNAKNLEYAKDSDGYIQTIKHKPNDPSTASGVPALTEPRTHPISKERSKTISYPYAVIDEYHEINPDRIEIIDYILKVQSEGKVLHEGQDYLKTEDGRLKILNQKYLDEEHPISVTFESGRTQPMSFISQNSEWYLNDYKVLYFSIPVRDLHDYNLLDLRKLYVNKFGEDELSAEDFHYYLTDYPMDEIAQPTIDRSGKLAFARTESPLIHDVSMSAIILPVKSHALPSRKKGSKNSLSGVAYESDQLNIGKIEKVRPLGQRDKFGESSVKSLNEPNLDLVKLYKSSDFTAYRDMLENSPFSKEVIIVVNGQIVGKGITLIHNYVNDENYDDLVSLNVLSNKNALAKYGSKGKSGVVEIVIKNDQINNGAPTSADPIKIRTYRLSKKNYKRVVEKLELCSGNQSGLNCGIQLDSETLKDDSEQQKKVKKLFLIVDGVKAPDAKNFDDLGKAKSEVVQIAMHHHNSKIEIAGVKNVDVIVQFFTKSMKETVQSEISNTQIQTDDESDLQPLFIVDGHVHFSYDIEKINPEDILHISVYKDGSALELFGEHAENGVINVITKNGVAVSKNHQIKGQAIQLSAPATQVVIESDDLIAGDIIEIDEQVMDAFEKIVESDETEIIDESQVNEMSLEAYSLGGGGLQVKLKSEVQGPINIYGFDMLGRILFKESTEMRHEEIRVNLNVEAIPSQRMIVIIGEQDGVIKTQKVFLD